MFSHRNGLGICITCVTLCPLSFFISHLSCNHSQFKNYLTVMVDNITKHDKTNHSSVKPQIYQMQK